MSRYHSSFISRNIIWFNPPFSKNVRTNVGRNFLNLIDKHFPASNPLHKIFNRNSVKVSNSCMDNCKSVISKHNFGTLLKNKSVVVASTKDNCNCIESTECPLNNNCLTKSVVYKAEVIYGRHRSNSRLYWDDIKHV